MLDFFVSLASFVVALGILVAVHEWGHFYVARLCGVKVLRFSIGFGKALFTKTGRTGTEYVIAAIPLGGYVKMLDERVETVPEHQKHLSFNHKPVYQRIAIVAAGPVVNFIFAVVALTMMYMIGATSAKPVISSIEPNSIFSAIEVDSGAVIKQVGDARISDWGSLNLELVSYKGRRSLPITIADSNGNDAKYNIDLQHWQFDPEKESVFDSLGINLYRPEVTKIIAQISSGSAAEKAKLQINDEIIAIDGTLQTNWRQIVDYIKQKPNQQVSIEIMRDGRLMTLDAALGVLSTENGDVGLLGVVPVIEEWPDGYLFSNQRGPIDALIEGAQRTWRLMTFSVEMLGKLITGDVSVKNLSGPISIAQGAGNHAELGIVPFLAFLALISVNLGIINLLPLPMLDGGHLMFYVIEWIKGSPVSNSIQEVGFKIGGALLFLLMATAIYNDIARII